MSAISGMTLITMAVGARRKRSSPLAGVIVPARQTRSWGPQSEAGTPILFSSDHHAKHKITDCVATTGVGFLRRGKRSERHITHGRGAAGLAMHAVTLDFATGCGVDTLHCSTRCRSNARSPAQANPIGTTSCRPGPAVSRDSGGQLVSACILPPFSGRSLHSPKAQLACQLTTSLYALILFPNVMIHVVAARSPPSWYRG
ncbi:hypothetical protein BO83DRAFT_458934 [Aspergillus eucalypticola CBS 122712]|uniref:Uncharacterized protein n=1 Tax=Aspergillus eucalypticola (strain CBS 122712 / IBT 29274) TaxID=1448314 RepID=A0A317UQP3_ASPEC|nr:uncharacterized protein BO83DRAFT_458934 [Aspergillus eucalypticola CBS 122712]PWY62350.1 hypothetical protein BO83DRAFT_458934 [Aspergillus eucalypticola CBS 122712]